MKTKSKTANSIRLFPLFLSIFTFKGNRLSRRPIIITLFPLVQNNLKKVSLSPCIPKGFMR
jgi:hypothetical protein